MSFAVPYIWIKGAHVAAALVFVGGVLAVAILLAGVPREGVVPEAARGVVDGAWRWNRRITTPAMLSVWGLGLLLAMDGNWFADGWLRAKFGVVLALSGLHGVQSGELRRMVGGEAGRPRIAIAAPLVALMALTIAILAVVKPF